MRNALPDRAIPILRRAAARQQSDPPAWLGPMCEEIRARCCESIRVTDLAKSAGVHPVHAARVFRRYMGCTIGEYVRTLRVERARSQLVETDRTLSSIAIGTGFSDQAHFTRRFKEVVGVPPGAYRKLAVN